MKITRIRTMQAAFTWIGPRHDFQAGKLFDLEEHPLGIHARWKNSDTGETIAEAVIPWGNIAEVGLECPTAPPLARVPTVEIAPPPASDFATADTDPQIIPPPLPVNRKKK